MTNRAPVEDRNENRPEYSARPVLLCQLTGSVTVIGQSAHRLV